MNKRRDIRLLILINGLFTSAQEEEEEDEEGRKGLGRISVKTAVVLEYEQRQDLKQLRFATTFLLFPAKSLP